MLFVAAQGRCQACGAALDAHWEADHRVPWCRTARTNVFEMQALCRTCNRKKGARCSNPVA
jgi:5-methylcytosine-specific restriction endonuclease McrA